MSPLSFTDRFRNALKNRGMQLTAPRQQVAESVGSFKKHFEAEELLAEIHRRNLPTSRATVYRTLELLVECGLVRMHVLPSRTARYEISDGRSHHAHIVCTHCKRIIEFKSPEIEEIIGRICSEHGVTDYELTIEVVGSCEQNAPETESGGHGPPPPTGLL